MKRSILRHLVNHLDTERAGKRFILILAILALTFSLVNYLLDYSSSELTDPVYYTFVFVVVFFNYQAPRWKVKVILEDRKKELGYKVNKGLDSNQTLTLKHRKLHSLNSSLVIDGVAVGEYKPYFGKKARISSHNGLQSISFPSLETKYQGGAEFSYYGYPLDLASYRFKLYGTVLEIRHCIIYRDKYRDSWGLFRKYFGYDNLISECLSTWRESRMPDVYLCAVQGGGNEWLFISSYELALLEEVG